MPFDRSELDSRLLSELTTNGESEPTFVVSLSNHGPRSRLLVQSRGHPSIGVIVREITGAGFLGPRWMIMSVLPGEDAPAGRLYRPIDLRYFSWDDNGSNMRMKTGTLG